DTSKNDAGVGEEFFLLLRKTAFERVLVLDPLAVKFVLRRPQKGLHQKVRIIGDRPAAELVLPAGLSFYIEQLRVVIADRHERVEDIVLGNPIIGNANREGKDLV